MQLDAAFEQTRALLPECQGSGIVDLRRARLVSFRLGAGAEPDLFESTAAAAHEMFDDEPEREEVVLLSATRLLVFLRAPAARDFALVCVCPRESSVGRVLTKLRVLIEVFDAALGTPSAGVNP